MPKILVVVAEAILRDRLTAELDAAGHQARGVAGAEDALLAAAEPLDLVILDALLPGVDGFALCRRLREAGVPAILLIAELDGVTEQLARESGADELLLAPFEMGELLDRVAALLQTEAVEESVEEPVVVDDLVIDLAANRVLRLGVPVALKPKEMELLAYLVRRRGAVCSTRQLLGEVWGYEYFGDSRTLAVHIHGLREKLGDDPSEPHLIQTMRGAGYRFVG
ncbi:MAG TPA: response regulator transcription factor [Thermomicrobiaceae bacterium]|nr:response regulator transcription factor [Thermomicrobiaceae bacterium]